MALLEYLGNSGCAFFRNGRWYDAARAREHLEDKYGYLAKRGLITSADTFIERAASVSGLSGRAYQVRCGATTTPSADWLTHELERLRREPAEETGD